MLITYTGIVHMIQACFSVQLLSTWLICTILYGLKVAFETLKKESKKWIKFFFYHNPHYTDI